MTNFSDRILKLRHQIRERSTTDNPADPLLSEILSLIESHRHDFAVETCVQKQPPYYAYDGGRTEEPS